MDAVVPSDLFEQFRSLRGAVAYCLLTRADIQVHVVFLQRVQEEGTQFRHIKMLNMLVKTLQQKPLSLRYEYLGEQTCFHVMTDAAFKKKKARDMR